MSLRRLDINDYVRGDALIFGIQEVDPTTKTETYPDGTPIDWTGKRVRIDFRVSEGSGNVLTRNSNDNPTEVAVTLAEGKVQFSLKNSTMATLTQNTIQYFVVLYTPTDPVEDAQTICFGTLRIE